MLRMTVAALFLACATLAGCKTTEPAGDESTPRPAASDGGGGGGY